MTAQKLIIIFSITLLTFSNTAYGAKSTTLNRTGISRIDDCKLTDQRIKIFQPNNVGFPLTQDILPNKGRVKIVFIPIDFQDAIGSEDPSLKSKLVFKTMREWYDVFSNKKVILESQHSNKWFRFSKSSSELPNLRTLPYGVAGEYSKKLAQEWIDLTRNSYNFAEVNAIFFDFPPGIKGFGEGTQGRADEDGKGVLLQTKQGPIRVFFNISGAYWYQDDAGASAELKQRNFWAYYIHEMLHSTGIAMHAPGNGFPIGLGQQNTGTPQGFSGVLDAWELFLLDWLNSSEIYCLSKKNLVTQNLTLTPLDSMKKGTKVALVALDQSRVLVVESRRPSGWSTQSPREASGLLAYVVDTRFDNDRSGEAIGDTGNQPEFSKWSYLKLPDGAQGGYSIRRNYLDYFIQPNQSVTVDEVKITYLKRGAKDNIRIEKIKNAPKD
ncbi:MAG: hypothetical protein ACO3JY_06330 [Candidatus Nanopelagicales bacterium]